MTGQWQPLEEDKGEIAKYLKAGYYREAAVLVVYLGRRQSVVKISHLRTTVDRRRWSEFKKHIQTYMKLTGRTFLLD